MGGLGQRHVVHMSLWTMSVKYSKLLYDPGRANYFLMSYKCRLVCDIVQEVYYVDEFLGLSTKRSLIYDAAKEKVD